MTGSTRYGVGGVAVRGRCEEDCDKAPRSGSLAPNVPAAAAAICGKSVSTRVLDAISPATKPLYVHKAMPQLSRGVDNKENIDTV